MVLGRASDYTLRRLQGSRRISTKIGDSSHETILLFILDVNSARFGVKVIHAPHISSCHMTHNQDPLRATRISAFLSETHRYSMKYLVAEGRRK